MNERKHINTQRAVPAEPHPDLSGRISFIENNLPEDEARKLADALIATKGYVRGPKAQKIHKALTPYLNSPDRVNRVESWAQSLEPGNTQGFRPEGRSFRAGSFKIKR